VFVNEHCEAVRSDLRRYYQVRLGDLFTGGLTWAEVSDYLRFLPMESATQTALRDSMTDAEAAKAATVEPVGHGPWSKQELLLATVIDAIGALTHVQIARAGVKDQKPLVPIMRPGVERPTRGPSPAALAYLQGIRDQHEAAEGA
jgi:hypothetical protein